MGDAFVNVRRGRPNTTFSYSGEYLSLPGSYAIDPALKLTTRNWAISGLPRAFNDAAPNKWGRRLIEKRLNAQAMAEGRAPSQIDDRDYLLGVSDETRQGALRFKTQTSDEFQHPTADIPRLIALPKLLRAADKVARDETDNMAAIKLLLDAGTGSLGGGRPKASVRDNGQLLIAKFPHFNDEWNIAAWEKTALDLAEAAGITVPHSRLVDVDGNSVLLLNRFDRDNKRRIGYISAMTMIESDDGELRDYLEIAQVIPEYSVTTNADLAELWRRIAFSTAIHNTDDHLRNHGFLHIKKGWSLAPAFDLNPNPRLAARRVTSIGGSANPVMDVQALLIYSEEFGLSEAQAKMILREIVDAVSNWPTVARGNNIRDAEIKRFTPTLTETIQALADAI